MKTLIKILCLSVLWFSCEEQNQDVHGCLDSQACNYNSNANIDNNSCLYEIDCNDECGGDAVEDCGGSCDNEYVELWGDCYNIETTTELVLSLSGLTGSIPSQIEYLTNLTYLDLYGNQLSGNIPSEIGNLIHLEWLNLYNNNLTGEIPIEIVSLPNLTNLYLHYNHLSGLIPIEICNIHTMAINDNKLCPPYPECIDEVTIERQDTSNCP